MFSGCPQLRPTWSPPLQEKKTDPSDEVKQKARHIKDLFQIRIHLNKQHFFTLTKQNLMYLSKHSLCSGLKNTEVGMAAKPWRKIIVHMHHAHSHSFLSSVSFYVLVLVYLLFGKPFNKSGIIGFIPRALIIKVCSCMNRNIE